MAAPDRARVSVAAVTDVGRLRERNEDAAVAAGVVVRGERDELADEVDLPVVVAAIDGMGGHPDGDVASRLAAEAIVGLGDEADPVAAMEAAHRAVLDGVRDGTGNRGMGCVVAMAVIGVDGLVVANVGDSSVHRVADDRLERLTRSDRGGLGGLTAFVGDPHVDRLHTHVREVGLDGHVRLVLSTDGLTDVVDEDDAFRLAREGSVSEAARALVEAALTLGAPDNVTVVVVDVPSG